MGHCISKKQELLNDNPKLSKEKQINSIKFTLKGYIRTEEEKKIQRSALKRELDKYQK